MKSEIIHFRITKEEKKRLTNLAIKQGRSISNYIRWKIGGENNVQATSSRPTK